MPLLEYQSLLACLWTDAALREEFARDPRGVGAQYRLTPTEIEGLLQLPLPDIQYFANSLHNKRRQEVAHFLPLTARALGGRYAPLFAVYSRDTPPLGPNGLRADAIGFVGYLTRKLEPPLRELARYEAAWLRMAQERHVLLVQRFPYPMLQLCRAVERGEATDGIPHDRHLAVWWRGSRGSRIQHRIFRIAIVNQKS